MRLQESNEQYILRDNNVIKLEKMKTASGFIARHLSAIKETKNNLIAAL